MGGAESREPEPEPEPEPTPTALHILDIMRATPLLEKMRAVRKFALRESLRAAQDDGAAIQIVLENVVDTPFVPAERRDALTQLLLSGEWSALRTALGCPPPPAPDDGTEPSPREPYFESFRAMVVAVFSASRKVARVPGARRRALGAAIHAATSVDALKELAIKSLETSAVFNEVERTVIANDIFDGRFDLLLRPNRFDCEEGERESLGALPERLEDFRRECPVCLGEDKVELRLPCGHELCRTCTTDWVRRSPSCPLCRAPTRMEQCQPCV